MAPDVAVNTKAGGVTDHVSGIGDVTVPYKHRLTGDGSSVHVALISFVKLPTAKRGIRNRKVEGGLALPISNRLHEQTNVVDHDVFVMPFDLRNAV